MKKRTCQITPGIFQLRRTITLDDSLLGVAKRLGNGNVSAGIRLALTVTRDAMKAMEKEASE